MAQKKKNPDYVSMWFWLFQWIVMAIPLVNIIMLFVWALAGENRSRKNYFKALLFVYTLGIALWAALVLLGLSPLIHNALREAIQSFNAAFTAAAAE